MFWSNQIFSLILVVLFFHPGALFKFESVFLTSDWIVYFGPIKHFVSFSAFYSFKFLTSDWIVVDVLVQSNILYHSRRFTLLKQIFFVVGGGGGGCTEATLSY